jgi:hypothetical protein
MYFVYLYLEYYSMDSICKLQWIEEGIHQTKYARD